MVSHIFEHGYALLIGVGDNLPVTVKDAEALRDLLIDPTRGSYSDEHVLLLTEKAASKENILKSFDHLIKLVNQDPEATVIVYFSGHGGKILDEKGKDWVYVLIPNGFKHEDLLTTSISGKIFTEKIEAITSKKLVVFLDCCHAGGIPLLKNVNINFQKSPIPPELIDSLSTGFGKVVVASSREDEISLTGEAFSIFTGCLLDSLNGSSIGKNDGFARILNILIYLFSEVPQQTNQKQHPFVNKVLNLSENFPLCNIPLVKNGFPLERSDNFNLGQEGGTRIKNRILQQEVDGLLAELDIRTKKLEKLRKALAFETDVLVQFKIENNISDEESCISQILDKIQGLFN